MCFDDAVHDIRDGTILPQVLHKIKCFIIILNMPECEVVSLGQILHRAVLVDKSDTKPDKMGSLPVSNF